MPIQACDELRLHGESANGRAALRRSRDTIPGAGRQKVLKPAGNLTALGKGLAAKQPPTMLLVMTRISVNKENVR
jgi:hypothetical protein